MIGPKLKIKPIMRAAHADALAILFSALSFSSVSNSLPWFWLLTIDY